MMSNTASLPPTPASTTQRKVGPFSVAPVGLGCMNLSHAYGLPATREQGERLLLSALDAGVDFFDTAALYGFGTNETLVGQVLKPHRHRFTLASKGGMAGETSDDGSIKRVIDGRPQAVRRHCEDSLRRLQTDCIDLYYLHRWDKRVPIEESVGEMARLRSEGKVRALGLSEVSATTLLRAHREHPIAAVQSEYSLWSRNAEIAVLQACRDIGAAFVAFSPVGRGFLTAQLLDIANFDAKDIRRSMPRFAPDAHAHNAKLLAPFHRVAQDAGCTPAQLALAWVLARGTHVVAIPGTTSVAHLKDDLGAARVKLTEPVMAQLDALFHPQALQGGRYNAQAQSEVDTEPFPHEMATW